MGQPVIAPHCVIIDDGVACRVCGHSYRLKMPVPVTEYLKVLAWFVELHKDCGVQHA